PPAHDLEAGPRRGRVSVVQPGADDHRGGEHHPAAAAGWPQGRPGVDRPDHRNLGHPQPAHAPAAGAVPGPAAAGRRGPGADEPPGNLDSRAGAEVLTFMRRAVDEMGRTIVMVTHDPIAASYADRIVFLADGRIVDEMHQPTAGAVLERMKQFGE